MRDPGARLVIEAERVVRDLKEPLAVDHFLRSELSRRWRERGDLVDFDILDNHTVTSRRIPFISLPAEWCDLQLYQAAELTLRLQCEAVEAGYDLKDASAWNVIFEGGRPVFCDLLSFEPLTQKRWWAAGQFARHFVLPLLLSRKRGFPAYKVFQAWRDGVPHDVARRMMGAGRFLTRYWPLMAGNGPARASEVLHTEKNVDLAEIRRFRAGLESSLGWMLRGVDPGRAAPQASTWANYVSERDHYAGSDIDAKRLCVDQWVRGLAPARVLDLGCNSGEFSRLAAAAGANVVAVDLDHVAIQRGAAQNSSGQISFLVAPLDDLRGGFGWNGAEHPGLPTRLYRYADLVLMLALIHHLVLAASIPMNEVARFASHCAGRWLIAELIAPEDVQISVIKTQRNRHDLFPSIEAQRAAFMAEGFKVVAQHGLPTGTRELVLMERVA